MSSQFEDDYAGDDSPRSYAARNDNVSVLRVPPQSPDAEQAVLGAIMLAPDCYDSVATIISDADFYRRDHQLIFRAIVDNREAGRRFDAVTLGEWFESHGVTEEIAGGAYLVELAANTPSAANVMAYAEIVRDKAMLRSLIDAGTDLANNGFDPEGCDTSEIYARHVGAITALGERIGKRDSISDPVDLFVELPPPILLPEYLPPVISRYAFDYAKVMGSAPEIIALTSVATAAASIHDDFRLMPKPDEPRWLERACLWTMIVADPGSKKTPAMKLALGPLLEIDRELSAVAGRKFAEFAEAERVFKINQKVADKRKAKAAAGETVGFEEDPVAPDKPRQERVFISDATIEAVADLCHDNPRGMTFFRDELTGWFGSMDAYSKGAGAKDRPKWLEAYNGGSMTVDRIGRGTKFIENWSMSVVGSIQPHVVKAMVAKSQDDGLFQRFMICEVPNEYRPAEERAPDGAAYHAYSEAIRKLWARTPNPDGGHIVRLDPEADQIRREFFIWCDRMSSGDGLPVMLRGHMAKWTGLWSRLVLTYHCIGCAVGGKWPTATPVTAATVRRVEALMKRYLLPQAVRFYAGDSSGDPVYVEVRKTASMILAHGMGRVAVRDMTRFSQSWRELMDYQRRSVISTLTEAGWLLTPDTKRRRGGQETAWTVNPAVHTLYAARATSERARRDATSSMLSEMRRAAGQKENPGV